MAKSLFSVFDEDFIREIREARNYAEAFEKANEKFTNRHGFPAFNSYETFRSKKRKAKR